MDLECRRCGRAVRVSAPQFEVFEQMHYVCFHYEFEHGEFDVDEECSAGGCPSASLAIGRAQSYKLVRLTSAEAGEVMTLQRAAYATEAQIYLDPFLPALTQSLTEVEDELRGFALGVRLGARLVGAVRWTVDAGVAHIGRLTIAPDLQGHGLGTQLLRAAEDASGVRDFELFTGHLSEANLRLYQREGYVLTRREVLREGVELVYLRKQTTDMTTEGMSL